MDLLLAGNFRWFFRKRLRITLIGDSVKINQTPVELNDQQLQVRYFIISQVKYFIEDKNMSWMRPHVTLPGRASARDSPQSSVHA